jgi:hypothetical protein
VKQLIVLVTLSVVAFVAHALLTASLSDVDLVHEILVRQSTARAFMACSLVAVRAFLIFVTPAWFLAALVGRR